MVLSPWRNQALPLPLSPDGFVPEMNNQPMPLPPRQGPAPAPELLSIIQHNCLGSWNVFLSLFELFKEATTYPSIVLLQDPPVNKAHLPSFNGFKSFCPPVRKPRVAAYVYMSFLSNYTVLPSSKEWTTSSPSTSPPMSLSFALTSIPLGLSTPTPPILSTIQFTPSLQKAISPILGFPSLLWET